MKIKNQHPNHLNHHLHCQQQISQLDKSPARSSSLLSQTNNKPSLLLSSKQKQQLQLQEATMHQNKTTNSSKHRQQKQNQRRKQRHKIIVGLKTKTHLLSSCALIFISSLLLDGTQLKVVQSATSAIKFDSDSNSYSGLTFTFDPRLDNKRVEWLHFEHWLSIMQQSSALLYEALNGRAHLAEVRVLIPYKWRQNEWSVLHKPGVPIIMNRRLLYSDSDVIVGFEGKLNFLFFKQTTE